MWCVVYKAGGRIRREDFLTWEGARIGQLKLIRQKGPEWTALVHDKHADPVAKTKAKARVEADGLSFRTRIGCIPINPVYINLSVRLQKHKVQKQMLIAIIVGASAFALEWICICIICICSPCKCTECKSTKRKST